MSSITVLGMTMKNALEYYYQTQKNNYDDVRTSLINVMRMMVKLEMLDKHDRPQRTIPDYINDYAETEKVTRVDKKAKRFF